jgi:plasmid stabilization system protein ParE
MSLRIQRSEWFIGDLEHYAAWYDREAGWEVAERYLRSVVITLTRLAEMPDIGRLTFFPAAELRGLRCWPVERPFNKHLIFYRHNEETLYAERIVHGARDLPKSLTNPPAAEEEQ